MLTIHNNKLYFKIENGYFKVIPGFLFQKNGPLQGEDLWVLSKFEILNKLKYKTDLSVYCI